MHKKHEQTYHILAFIFPALCIAVIFLLYPSIGSIWVSLFSDGEFVGLSQYLNLIHDESFLQALTNNIIWVAIHLPVTLILGLLFALLFSKNIIGKNVLQTIIFVGMIIPMVIGGILVRFLFAKDSGMISSLMGNLGLEMLDVNWTGKTQLVLPALIIVSIWLWTGYSMIMYLAGLSMMSKSLLEAAVIDGANAWQRFIYVILPLLRPITGVIITMTIIWELKLFDIVYASTAGAPGGTSNVLALEMYQATFREDNFNKGAAISVVMTILAAIPIIYFVSSQLKKEE